MALLTHKFKSQGTCEVEASKSPAQAESIIKTPKYKARLDATYLLVQKVSVGAARRSVRDRSGLPLLLSITHSELLLGELKPVIGPWNAILEQVITVDWMRDAYTGGGWIVSP